MRTSPEGRAFITRWEGVRANSYRDVAGFWTIGVGHLLTKEEQETGMIRGVAFIGGLTPAEVDEVLTADLLGTEVAVAGLVKPELTQPQFDALVSFTFNLGAGALHKSTLLKYVNAGEFDKVPAELLKWCRAGGAVIAGLKRRREAEAKLWSEGDYGA